MINNRTLCFFILLAILCIVQHPVSQNIDINKLKKLQSEYEGSDEKMKSRLLAGLKEEKDEHSLVEQDDSTNIDSTMIDQEEKAEQDQLFVYQNIIDDNIINPDSILSDLEIFGHSVFLKKRSPKFIPDEQIAIPADYSISSGDEIKVLMWGRINEEHSLTVDRNGRITIPRIGPISVAGQPFSSMKKNITKRIESIEGVQATVSMGDLSSMRIFIVGEVNVPGQYTVSALTNVTNAIFHAQGFSKRGSMRNVTLKRNGKTIKRFDFYDFLLKGNNFGNVRLQSGDVIFIPVVKNMAVIGGNVRRSALYELKGKTKLSDLISLAGGLTPAAWVNRIQIERFQKNDQQNVLDIEVSSEKELPSIEILDGDIVKIFPVVKLDHNAVTLSGNVLRPGIYEFKENMKITDVLNSHEQLLPETYFNYAIIRRKEAPTYAERIVSFDLGEVLKNPNSLENLALKPLDNIVIYNQDYFQPDRTVSIGGSITKPGVYKLLENMSIKDLVLEAGGLKDDASTDRGELYKRELSHDSVKTIKVDFNIEQAMLNNPDHNHLLKKSDYVYIRRKKGWEEQRTISLIGEFNFPGEYIILENETLGDLIVRAGGFKPGAYLSAAILTRETVKELEKKRNEDYIKQLEMDMVTLTAEASSQGGSSAEALALLDQQKKLLETLKEMEPVGRVVIDFEKPENYKNLQIEDGDVLYVPKNHNTVSVIGEVFNPSTFVLEHNQNSVDYYVQLAGGFKETANEKNVYVIKANGSVRTKKMVRLSRYNLESGDAVVVPIRIPATNKRFQMILSTTKDLMAITSSTLLIAATINSL